MVINAIFVREEGKVHLIVYYISNSIVLTETRYPSFKKLALVLLVASRKLKPYFPAHIMTVLTSHPLRQVLYCLETLGWLMKCSMELSQYKICYLVKVTIKRQAVENFIIELTPSKELNQPQNPMLGVKESL